MSNLSNLLSALLASGETPVDAVRIVSAAQDVSPIVLAPIAVRIARNGLRTDPLDGSKYDPRTDTRARTPSGALQGNGARTSLRGAGDAIADLLASGVAFSRREERARIGATFGPKAVFNFDNRIGAAKRIGSHRQDGDTVSPVGGAL